MDQFQESKAATGVLYVVATPIGNLQDITERAVEVLRKVDLVVAEDTRRTRKLLTHLGIAASLESYHGDSSPQKTRHIADQLSAGKQIALLSDSGTPAVSDPGAKLIQAALDSGAKLVPIPGPSAVTTAFSVAGIAASGFVFVGYPPRKQIARQQFLQQIAADRRPTIFYEATSRVVDTLKVLAEICPQRRIVLVREATKLHEEIRDGPVADICEYLSQKKPLGEFTFVLESAPAGFSQRQEPDDNLIGAVERMLAGGLTHRDAAQIVELLTGLSRNQAYELVGHLYQ